MSGDALSRRAALNKMTGCASRNDLQMVGTFASVFIPMKATMPSATSICPHTSRKGGLPGGERASLAAVGKLAMLMCGLYSFFAPVRVQIGKQ